MIPFILLAAAALLVSVCPTCPLMRTVKERIAHRREID